MFDESLNEQEQVAISNTNQVEVYDMEKHKQTKRTKQVKADNSLMSFDEALLVVGHSLKSDSDLLRLERLVQAGCNREQILAAFS